MAFLSVYKDLVLWYNQTRDEIRAHLQHCALIRKS